MQNDLVFAADFQLVKLAQKHNLEQTMYQQALQPRGFMDRMAWLRKNYPQEYNPNVIEKDQSSTDALKELSSKWRDYELIPKKKIIEGETDALSVASTKSVDVRQQARDGGEVGEGHTKGEETTKPQSDE